MTNEEICKDLPRLCRKIKCGPNPPDKPCLTVIDRDTPGSINHEINTHYIVSINNHDIDIIKTDRKFTLTTSIDYSKPTDLILFGSNVGGVAPWVWCSSTQRQDYFLFSEDCSMTFSTLHYLDMSNNVCLYSTRAQRLIVKKASKDTVNIQGPYGLEIYHWLEIYKSDLQMVDTKSWHLIKDGANELLASDTREYNPFPEFVFGEGAPYKEGLIATMVSPTLGCFWRPLDKKIEWYPPYQIEYITCEGTESRQNQLDGGCKDMYYPAWCRQMGNDPIWRAAADRRYSVSWFKEEIKTDQQKYRPPPITVDPIPRGTFVKHPQVGEVYQFLVEKRTGGYKLETSPNIDDIINNAVPEDQRQQGTTLYYPIGVL